MLAARNNNESTPWLCAAGGYARSDELRGYWTQPGKTMDALHEVTRQVSNCMPDCCMVTQCMRTWARYSFGWKWLRSWCAGHPRV